MTTALNIRPIINQVLTENGWIGTGDCAIAMKTFKTAVGDKVAHAYLSIGDEYNRTLSGDYQSEGRNALESSCILIPVDADADTVRRLVKKFAEQADKAVGQTYAAKLYRADCDLV